MRSGTRLAVFSLLALCTALAVGGSGAAANNNPGASGNPLVVTYSTPGQLSDVTRTTIRGFPTGTGMARLRSKRARSRPTSRTARRSSRRGRRKASRARTRPVP